MSFDTISKSIDSTPDLASNSVASSGNTNTNAFSSRTLPPVSSFSPRDQMFPSYTQHLLTPSPSSVSESSPSLPSMTYHRQFSLPSHSPSLSMSQSPPSLPSYSYMSPHPAPAPVGQTLMRSNTMNDSYVTAHLAAARKTTVAPFLKSLFEMLASENDDVIGWKKDGLSFEVRDHDEFVKDILPRYFRHHKFASFQRQLNYFGFRKINKSKTSVSTYVQPHFQRDNPALMHMIKRKTHGARTSISRSNSLEPGARMVMPLSAASMLNSSASPHFSTQMSLSPSHFSQSSVPNEYLNYSNALPTYSTSTLPSRGTVSPRKDTLATSTSSSSHNGYNVTEFRDTVGLESVKTSPGSFPSSSYLDAALFSPGVDSKFESSISSVLPFPDVTSSEETILKPESLASWMDIPIDDGMTTPHGRFDFLVSP